MKLLNYILPALALFSFTACEEKPKTTGEKVKDKVGDALDTRPHEKVRDAVEDVKDSVKK